MRCVAYTDGSFSVAKLPGTGEELGIYGAGVYLIMEDEEEPITLKFAGSVPELAKMRNVAGELTACIQLVRLLQEEFPQCKQLDIYYDYVGIEKWVTGEWKANKPHTRAYRDFMRDAQQNMIIRFFYVEAHSGIAYNECADKLAKAAVAEEAKNLGLILN